MLNKNAHIITENCQADTELQPAHEIRGEMVNFRDKYILHICRGNLWRRDLNRKSEQPIVVENRKNRLLRFWVTLSNTGG